MTLEALGCLEALGYGDVLIHSADTPPQLREMAERSRWQVMRIGARQEDALHLPEHRYNKEGIRAVAFWLDAQGR